MIDLPSCSGKSIAVLGLGASGLAAAASLAASGARVQAWDDSEAKRGQAEKAGISLVDLHGIDWQTTRTLVLSPGIPHRFPAPHPVAARARDAGVEILCDVELLGRNVAEAAYVGITGTNGKSTTTALVGHVLAGTGRQFEIGGNLGPAALSLRRLDRDGVYVLELSSYQLELILSTGFDVAVLLNIAPDHLGRHGGMEGYVAAKRRLFDRQDESGTAVVGVDDDHSSRIHDELVARGRARVVPISSSRSVEGGAYVLDGVLFDTLEGGAARVTDLRRAPALPGRHNWQNAAAAYAVARILGIERDAAARLIASFPGLAHRQEMIAIIDGVRYVNDSKATNADAAEKALTCYDRIYWILGGQPKEDGIDALAPYFPRIVHAFLIGEAAAAFAKVLDGRVPHTISGDLANAVADARNRASGPAGARNAVVLLSPACASFDQFANFEARGDMFRTLVSRLPGSRQPTGAAA